MTRKQARKRARKLHRAGYLHPEIVKAYKVPGWYLRIHPVGHANLSYTLISRREVRDMLAAEDHH